MIVIGTNRSLPPSAEVDALVAERRQHANDFILVCLKETARLRRTPIKYDDIIDEYEKYVEKLGATRTERRQAVSKMRDSFASALCGLRHRNLVEQSPAYEFSLTESGREAAKLVKSIFVPESVFVPKG